ncbi:metallophosphoesterase [Dermatobacter hominis]|uniref:metallophosphoesterase n=1 Tax=Dermatobacter hominis TaxID=2884263 RepID=UPI001D11D7E7|nr:metallophosphoesterase [Dermatobacter hominis]UDY37431.1 metallophosphoesterase [Dermatobacter hominis]
MREVTVALTVLALVWAAAGLGVWWVLRRRPLLAVVLALATIGVAAVTSVVAWGVLGGLSSFGGVHGLYLAVVVSVPLLGVGVLVTTIVRPVAEQGRRTSVLVLGTALVLPALLGFYATHVAPFQLRVETVDAAVEPGRDGHDTIRIAVLSDIQTTGAGDLEREAVRAAMAADPDIVLIPGDVLQADGAELEAAVPAMRELLGELRAPGGVYMVGGDVETPERLWAKPESIRMLDDEVVTTTVGDRTVAIGGTRLDFDSPDAQRVKDELLAQDAGTVRILLSHRPDTVLGLPPASGVDLTVAGHTHGGQVSVPFVGPLVTLTAVPRSVAAGGLHEVAGNRIYVSPGIGMERGHAPQIRFGVPPTVGIVDLG